MTAQTIVTPAGEELVVLPRAEYDALLDRLAELEEDAADVAAYDLAKAGHAAGPNAAPVSPDMLRGALIRHWRKSRRMTQEQLADATGLQQGFVSDLESGRRRGSSETIDKIASALGLDATVAAALRA